MGKIDDRGVGGPFEDIPALIIVIIGFTIFISTSFYSYSIYFENHTIQKPEDICWNMLKNFRSYQVLLVDGGGEGDFSYRKLQLFFKLKEREPEEGVYKFDDDEIYRELSKNFNILSKYHFIFIIIDKSDYDSNQLNIVFNSKDFYKNNYYTKNCPITITEDNNNHIHNCELVVGIGWNE